MKRITTLLVLLLCATTIFAAEGKYGLDFSFGISAGFQSQEGRILGEAVKLKRTDLLLPVKISTYDYFLLDNMLGIYGSISLSPLGAFMGEKVNGIEAGNMMGINEMAAGFEFIIGPAFGIDLGDSNIRFQTGAGFHLLVAKTTTEIIMEENCPELFTAMGFGLTPQFRFGANNKISFIVGCDFIFDFGFSTSREVYNIDRYLISMPEAEINKFFRFGITPQLGFGINF
ncbi:MAG: hypothetical protein SPE30_07125 [Candidatus Treponema excrementipullorum]|nr:hypothetical protein [Spirochaetia bacterium]MDY4466040.1 hypothetical protein [Candidatus Treponema excrementipullorum]